MKHKLYHIDRGLIGEFDSIDDPAATALMCSIGGTFKWDSNKF